MFQRCIAGTRAERLAADALIGEHAVAPTSAWPPSCGSWHSTQWMASTRSNLVPVFVADGLSQLGTTLSIPQDTLNVTDCRFSARDATRSRSSSVIFWRSRGIFETNYRTTSRSCKMSERQMLFQRHQLPQLVVRLCILVCSSRKKST